MTYRPDQIETERRNRILASLYAYAYEIMDHSLVTDSRYDELCRTIRPDMETGNAVMDDFFRDEFDPSTGMWIFKHPEPNGIENIYHQVTGKCPRPIPRYKNKSPPAAPSVAAYGSHFMQMAYLASLGFSVAGGRYVGQVVFDYEFDTDFVHIKHPETGDARSVSYRELFVCRT